MDCFFKSAFFWKIKWSYLGGGGHGELHGGLFTLGCKARVDPLCECNASADTEIKIVFHPLSDLSHITRAEEVVIPLSDALKRRVPLQQAELSFIHINPLSDVSSLHSINLALLDHASRNSTLIKTSHDVFTKTLLRLAFCRFLKKDEMEDLFLIFSNHHKEQGVFQILEYLKTHNSTSNPIGMIAYIWNYYVLETTRLPKPSKFLDECLKKIKELLCPKAMLNLKTAVRDAKLAQDLELESLCSGAGHSQVVKDRPTANDSGSRDCGKLASPTAVFRLNRATQVFDASENETASSITSSGISSGISEISQDSSWQLAIAECNNQQLVCAISAFMHALATESCDQYTLIYLKQMTYGCFLEGTRAFALANWFKQDPLLREAFILCFVEVFKIRKKKLLALQEGEVPPLLQKPKTHLEQFLAFTPDELGHHLRTCKKIGLYNPEDIITAISSWNEEEKDKCLRTCLGNPSLNKSLLTLIFENIKNHPNKEWALQTLLEMGEQQLRLDPSEYQAIYLGLLAEENIPQTLFLMGYKGIIDHPERFLSCNESFFQQLFSKALEMMSQHQVLADIAIFQKAIKTVNFKRIESTFVKTSLKTESQTILEGLDEALEKAIEVQAFKACFLTLEKCKQKIKKKEYCNYLLSLIKKWPQDNELDRSIYKKLIETLTIELQSLKQVDKELCEKLITAAISHMQKGNVDQVTLLLELWQNSFSQDKLQVHLLKKLFLFPCNGEQQLQFYQYRQLFQHDEQIALLLKTRQIQIQLYTWMKQIERDPSLLNYGDVLILFHSYIKEAPAELHEELIAFTTHIYPNFLNWIECHSAEVDTEEKSRSSLSQSIVLVFTHLKIQLIDGNKSVSQLNLALIFMHCEFLSDKADHYISTLSRSKLSKEQKSYYDYLLIERIKVAVRCNDFKKALTYLKQMPGGLEQDYLFINGISKATEAIVVLLSRGTSFDGYHKVLQINEMLISLLWERGEGAIAACFQSPSYHAFVVAISFACTSQERLDKLVQNLLPKIEETIVWETQFVNDRLSEFHKRAFTESEIKSHVLTCLTYGPPYSQFCEVFSENLKKSNHTEFGKTNFKKCVRLLERDVVVMQHFDSMKTQNELVEGWKSTFSNIDPYINKAGGKKTRKWLHTLNEYFRPANAYPLMGLSSPKENLFEKLKSLNPKTSYTKEIQFACDKCQTIFPKKAEDLWLKNVYKILIDKLMPLHLNLTQSFEPTLVAKIFLSDVHGRVSFYKTLIFNLSATVRKAKHPSAEYDAYLPIFDLVMNGFMAMSSTESIVNQRLFILRERQETLNELIDLFVFSKTSIGAPVALTKETLIIKYIAILSKTQIGIITETLSVLMLNMWASFQRQPHSSSSEIDTQLETVLNHLVSQATNGAPVMAFKIFLDPKEIAEAVWTIIHYGLAFVEVFVEAVYDLQKEGKNEVVTNPVSRFNLDPAVRDGKLMQDLELESLCNGVGHSQRVLDRHSANDSGSRDCVKLPSPTAGFRFKPLIEQCKVILKIATQIALHSSPSEEDPSSSSFSSRLLKFLQGIKESDAEVVAELHGLYQFAQREENLPFRQEFLSRLSVILELTVQGNELCKKDIDFTQCIE